jgi:phospholipid transport system transporter-binding protein
VKPDKAPLAMMQPTPTGFTLAGPLTIATASVYVDAARSHWPQEGDAIIDFAGVTEADSAALALIFKWQRDAEKKGRKIRCLNIPANVLTLAKLYGVDDLITA